MAGKQIFCKLDGSQAYHCLQMADQRSIEMLASIFSSRTFAYRRLAQGLIRALTAFSNFMREYLDKLIKADQCTQYLLVDDIGISANNATRRRQVVQFSSRTIHWKNIVLSEKLSHQYIWIQDL